MNKGIRQAKGEYCLLLNSADYLCHEHVLEQVFRLNFHEDIVYGNTIDEYSDGKKHIKKYTQDLRLSFLFNSALPHQASFIKRVLFERIGCYNERYKYASDWEFCLLALVKHACSHLYIDTNVVYYDTSGISCNIDNWNEMQEERHCIIRQHFPLLYLDYVELNKLRRTVQHFDYKAYKVGRFILTPCRIARKLFK